MNKTEITNSLKKIGLYKPIRAAYNFAARYNKRTEIFFHDKKIKFWTPTFYLNEYVKNYIGEEKLLETFLSHLTSSDVLWDIGANIGFYSILSSNIILDGKIYAFEPEPKSYKLLRKNIQLNGAENIFAFPYALGNADGEVVLYQSDTPNFGAHSFVQRTDYKLKRKGISAKMYKGDTLIREKKLEVPTVLKIDVEGAKALVLKGMESLLSNQNLHLILCEAHLNLLPLFNSSLENILSEINQKDFSIDYKSERTNQIQFIFKRKS